MTSRVASGMSGLLPGKKPSEARTSVTGHPTPRISSAVGLVLVTSGVSSLAAVVEHFGL